LFQPGLKSQPAKPLSIIRRLSSAAITAQLVMCCQVENIVRPSLLHDRQQGAARAAAGAAVAAAGAAACSWYVSFRATLCFAEHSAHTLLVALLACNVALNKQFTKEAVFSCVVAAAAIMWRCCDVLSGHQCRERTDPPTLQQQQQQQQQQLQGVAVG
jgi:hypothetical protein